MPSDMPTGDMMPPTGADGAPVDQHGTKRDFGNMLNAYMPKRTHHKKPSYEFSPWTKMTSKKEK